VIALNDQQWSDWLAGKKLPPIPMAGRELTQADRDQADRAARIAQATPLAEQGRHVFESKGCVSCHALQGAAKIGPNLQGLYGKKVDLADGSSVVADDSYVRESIENPQSQLVRGYSPLMPTFKGLLKPAELNALVAFVNGSLILVAQAFFGALDALVLTYTFFVNGLICAVLDLLFFFVEALFLCLCPGVMLLSGLFNVGFLCFLFFVLIFNFFAHLCVEHFVALRGIGFFLSDFAFDLFANLHHRRITRVFGLFDFVFIIGAQIANLRFVFVF
jgi:cytochrome c2